mmetsp:Transcript_13043/g.34901  ORF Transcript_13043/g.34901 Transcript_13043/m.34901 type:complete len:268 (-) Transcript_13043:83-886(-)
MVRQGLQTLAPLVVVELRGPRRSVEEGLDHSCRRGVDHVPLFLDLERLLLGHVRPMLDGCHASVDRGLDPGGAVGVRRHRPLCAPRVLGDCPHLIQGQLRVGRLVELREHPARRHDLDDVGLQPEILARPLQALGDAVTQRAPRLALAVKLADDAQRQQLLVCVARRYPDGTAGVMQVRALDPARPEQQVQGLAEGASDLPHGGDTHLQGLAELFHCVLKRDVVHGKGVVHAEVGSQGGGGLAEVRVAIPQSRHDRLCRIGPVRPQS